MAGFILRRLLWLVPVLLFISLITFALMHAVPGGPWDPDDRPLRPEIVENLRVKYGWDKPLWRQYTLFLQHAARGDLGISVTRQDKPVTEVILTGFRATAVVGVLGLALATVVGVGLGVWSATQRGRAADRIGVLFASLGSAVPSFVFGIFLIYVFGVKLHLLPTFGWDTRHGIIQGWIPKPQQLVLPVITLAALPSAFLARVTRASLLEVLQQDYVRTARAKGLGRWSILARYSLRNAVIPILTVVGPITAGLITGSFIVEQLFSVPGTGRLLVQSITARDYNMIMGATLFYATIIAIANLVIDVAYAAADPRIRYR